MGDLRNKRVGCSMMMAYNRHAPVRQESIRAYIISTSIRLSWFFLFSILVKVGLSPFPHVITVY